MDDGETASCQAGKLSGIAPECIREDIDRVIVSTAGGTKTMVKARNYLRARRREWHLTQEELAFLFGYTNDSIISRLERQERTITLAVAYACQVLFGCDPREVFPAVFDQFEADVIQRLYELQERLQQARATKASAAKQKLLQQALTRVTDDDSQKQEV